MDKSSAVDSAKAIEPTCSGLAHSTQAGLLALGWARHACRQHGRLCRILAATSVDRVECAGRRGASDLFQPYM